jgi:L-histidine Nalpha-methyltransferase
MDRLRFFDTPAPGDTLSPAAEAAAGLRARPAALPPKFFYDALGSRLFDAITALPEYYPTRTEAAIFAAKGHAIAAAVQAALGPSPTLIDLGAGSCEKAAALFPVLQPSHYVAVDISAQHLRGVLARLQRLHPTVAMTGVGLDFADRLVLPPAVHDAAQPALVFYPGSSIGNFGPEAARRLLRQARTLAAGGALLIGVDRVKPHAVLEAAYDDALGVTAAFNLNVLRHVNTLLGSDFDVRQWQHVAFFDEAASRIEMHLQARQALTVRWPGEEWHFAAGERIHTEHSYKWTPEAFTALLHDAGWGGVQHWTDERGWFSLFLARG